MKNEEKEPNDFDFNGKQEELLNKSDEIDKINQEDDQDI